MLSRRFALAAVILVLAGPALSQVRKLVAPQVAPIVHVKMTTSHGAFVLALDRLRAPITTAAFLRYVDQKRLDGTSFWRRSKVEGWPNLGFVQFGTQNDLKRTLPPIAHEPTSKTGLRHEEGTISVSRFAPGTARGDFVITLGLTPELDADPKRAGDNQGNAAFGRVVEGMDVVRKIHTAPTSATKGTGVFKGELLDPPVKIITARRVNWTPPLVPSAPASTPQVK